jgi:hypothetical protein
MFRRLGTGPTRMRRIVSRVGDLNTRVAEDWQLRYGYRPVLRGGLFVDAHAEPVEARERFFNCLLARHSSDKPADVIRNEMCRIPAGRRARPPAESFLVFERANSGRSRR